MKLGRDRDALQSFDKALAINPNFAKSFYNRAMCYALQGETDNSLENLRQAIQINPAYKEDVQADEAFEDLWQDNWFKELVDF